MLRIRQVVLVVRDLERAVADLCAVLGVEVSFRDPDVAFFGLENAVMPVGDTFLEVVSPVAADAPAERFLRAHGEGGYMLMLQTDRFDEDRGRLEGLGVRTVWSVELDDIRGMHLHPKDTGGCLLSVDQPVPPSAWRWAGPDWSAEARRDAPAGIVGVNIRADQPKALARRWSQVLGRQVSEDVGGLVRIPLHGGEISFCPCADGGSERLDGFEVRVDDPARVRTAAAARDIAFHGGLLRMSGVSIRLVSPADAEPPRESTS